MALVGIIGAGIGGIATAVQLARYGIESVIFERDRIGGLIRNAYSVENTMFFPDGINGEKVVELLEEYVRKYGLKIIYEEVMAVKKVGGLFEVETASGVHHFKYLVVANGTRPRKLPFDGVIYHVAEVPRRHYKRVLIIGGGDVAFDYALTMSETSDEVVILMRSEPKALPYLQELVKRRSNIKTLMGQVWEIKPISGKQKLLARTSAGDFEVDLVLGAIGRIPNIELVEGIEDDNLFLVGDVKNGIYRQTALAIADGIKTAMVIWRRERYGDTE
ncbi:pyridine nucleotide-disulfide oxidoreductase [Thermococcus celericrescens]|uniref:Pyridine nucleotide-disulfide oxidoreductase n=1 Tax=Thermococcus celericrescens TaxID=227598 RepID=A0A124EB11_9EURY|nr:NAD(P)/FAD-dependent oxidoreductase [Thermococcus celericrescens]KUH32013.1 pyridine nucleotide-disulfide oxidoreductase [Thermococcus celericrescens]